jgi:hypothetical protein
MIFNIFEANKDVDSLISHLESLVVKLRRSGKLDTQTLELIQDLFNNEIAYYMSNYYIPEVEINSKYEEQIINDLIDITSILYKIQ